MAWFALQIHSIIEACLCVGTVYLSIAKLNTLLPFTVENKRFVRLIHS